MPGSGDKGFTPLLHQIAPQLKKLAEITGFTLPYIGTPLINLNSSAFQPPLTPGAPISLLACIYPLGKVLFTGFLRRSERNESRYAGPHPGRVEREGPGASSVANAAIPHSTAPSQASQRRRHKCEHGDRALQQGQVRQLDPGVDHGRGDRPSWSVQRCRAGEEEREAYLHNILNWIEAGPQRCEAALVMASTV